MPHLGRTIEAEYAPGELKTFLVPLDADQPVREVNLIEWPVEEGL
jgi:alpha-mannosidase